MEGTYCKLYYGGLWQAADLCPKRKLRSWMQMKVKAATTAGEQILAWSIQTVTCLMNAVIDLLPDRPLIRGSIDG